MTALNADGTKADEWTVDGMTYQELVEQPYTNMRISAGFILDGAVKGHERNTVYLRIESDTEPETFVLLTDDEMAAVAYCASGALWSRLMAEREDTCDAADTER